MRDQLEKHFSLRGCGVHPRSCGAGWDRGQRAWKVTQRPRKPTKKPPPIPEDVYKAVREVLRKFEKEAGPILQEQRFKALAEQWKRETRFISNITTKSINPAYQKIIGMGEVAVRFILKDLLENGPRDWFWALHVITDANPVNEDIAGNMVAMTEAWLEWGKRTGYLPDYLPKTRRASQLSTASATESTAPKTQPIIV